MIEARSDAVKSNKYCNITVIQVYALTSNAEEAEAEWFCEDLQDLLALTPKNDVLFITETGIQESPQGTGMQK